MRRPRVRMTVGALMNAIAFVGLTLFGSITAMRMSQRAKVYQSRAMMWSSMESRQRTHLGLCRKEVDGAALAATRLRERGQNIYNAEELAKRNAGDAIWWQANAAHTEDMIAFSALMRQKYERAARYPWLALAPDSPMAYWSGETGPPPDEPSATLALDHADQDVDSAAKPN
jgi:hypothetical protein